MKHDRIGVRCSKGGMRMADYEVHHEIVASNQDVDVRFYLSVDQGSYVAPHWHDSLELVYMLEGSIIVTTENQKNVLQAG